MPARTEPVKSRMPVTQPVSSSAGEVPVDKRPVLPKLRELSSSEALKHLTAYARQSITTIELLKDQNLQPADTDQGTQIGFIPEDYIEVPGIRFKRKTNRESLLVEERACTEIQQNIKLAQAELDNLDAKYRLEKKLANF